MAYRSPYLDILAEDEEVQNKNEGRVLNAMNLINQAPMTVNDLVNEELTRKENLRKTKKNEEQEDSRIALSDRNTKINESAEKRVGENADRDFWNKRIGERIENVVMGTTAGYKPEGQQPVASQPAPAPQTPMQQDVRSQGIANPETFAKATGIPNNAPNAPIVEQPAATAPSAQPSIGGPPMTKQEVISAYATDPQIQVMYKQALAALNNDPNFRKYYTDEEVLGIIVKQKTGRDNELAKQSLAQSKANSAKELNDARIEKLKRKSSGVGPKPELRGLTQQQVKLLTEERIKYEDIASLASNITNGSYEPGIVTGLENTLRDFIKMRSTGQAENSAKLANIANQYITDKFGATVPKAEMDRALAALPQEFDSPDVMLVFLERLAEESERRYNYTLEYVEKGRRSGTPMTERDIPPLGDNPKTGSKPAGKQSVRALFDEVLGDIE